MFKSSKSKDGIKTIDIFKSRRHDHFWVEGEKLYESYMTIRGLRYRCVGDAKGILDIDKCEPSDLPSFVIHEYEC